MPTLSELLTGIDAFFTITLGPTIFIKAASLIDGITPIFSLGFAVYVLLLTFHYYNRGIDESLLDISKNVLGWTIVLAIALNVGNYAKIATALYGLPDQLSAWLTGTKLEAAMLSKSFAAIQQMVATILKIGNEASTLDIFTPLISVIVAVLSGLMGVIVVLFTYIYFLIAKTSLALVLMIGPPFIAAMLFPSTRQYGMNWIGQVLNNSVLIALNAIVSTLLSAYVAGLITQFNPDAPNWIVLLDILIGLFLFTVIAIIVTMNIPSIASALTGGATISTQARDLAHLGKGIKKLLPKSKN